MLCRLTILLLMVIPGMLLVGCGDKSEPAPEQTGQMNAGSKAINKLLEGDGAGKKVVTTVTGLQYLDLKVGTGSQPKTGQTCTTHATLMLLDGTKVWSSRDPSTDGRVTPFDFVIDGGQVIPGWNEGVSTMKKGGMRRLAIPSDIGYGEAGRPPAIPGGATLIFEIELLAIN